MNGWRNKFIGFKDLRGFFWEEGGGGFVVVFFIWERCCEVFSFKITWLVCKIVIKTWIFYDCLLKTFSFC
jgi:hypothetical protein